MKKMYKVCAFYDTETTNIGEGNNTRAFPVLFIINDIRTIDLTQYTPKANMDCVHFFRNTGDFLEYLRELILWGYDNNIIPIIAAYNLMFDLQPLMHLLNIEYKMSVNAQTATSAYTVDLLDDKEQSILRFWDTFYLEMGGLYAMGETCGFEKAIGDWDYSLIRTPNTELTDNERFYASRDVEVIPAYLAYLLRANEWLKADMFGCRVLTKTSLVRQMAMRELGGLKYRKSSGKSMTLLKSFEMTCKQEFPKSYQQYALRKSCFRGGLTFTSGNYASQVWHNVVSLDVTSMHHTFINGRLLPVHFRPYRVNVLTAICNDIINTSIDDVLKVYYKPFNNAIHARIEFTNLRIKHDSVFSAAGIGIIPQGKFTKTNGIADIIEDVRAKMAEESIRLQGWKDRAINPVFAFGKLISADTVILHVNEVELWCINQVYDYDSFSVRLGEATSKFTVPPDYVTLQSNMLFERKQDMKHILKNYNEGEKYMKQIPASIPEGIKKELINGSANTQFLQSYYGSTIKGMFNGIYGTQAMDLLKPNFIVTDGDIEIDRTTIVTPTNFMDKLPDKPRVLYTYGMRIVAGSRMHLIIALELLARKFGDRIKPTGGDTDSIKCATDVDVTDDDLSECLKPLADASDTAIAYVQRRNRRNFPSIASQLSEIGHFDIEMSTNKSTRWHNHYEAWNKARISENDGNWHVTCAGLSRPRNAYHIEHFCEDLQKAGYDFEQIAKVALGYNTFVGHSICHALQHYRPAVTDYYHGDVVDYMGRKSRVDAPQSIALYSVGRWLGEADKRANAENVAYLRQHNISVDTDEKMLDYDGINAIVYKMNDMGEMVVFMKGVSHGE